MGRLRSKLLRRCLGSQPLLLPRPLRRLLLRRPHLTADAQLVSRAVQKSWRAPARNLVA
jgi:hypothetical protein